MPSNCLFSEAKKAVNSRYAVSERDLNPPLPDILLANI